MASAWKTSKELWHGLLRSTVLRRAAPARPDWFSPTHNQVMLKPRDSWLFNNVGRLIKSIDIDSLAGCKEPVSLTASDTQVLCSWNEASGPRQAITVPGDASRPRATSLPPTNLRTRGSSDPAITDAASEFSGPDHLDRGLSWDDSLASLCVMNPNFKLDDVDVMVHFSVLVHLFAVARRSFKIVQQKSAHGMALDMSLVNNTLVITRRKRPLRPSVPTQSMEYSETWGFFKAATDPVPAIEHSSLHYRLLRYKIGPLSCVVKTLANGTIQEMPAPRGPSGPQETRHVHGIDVIAAGQGILTDAAFLGSARPRPDPHTGRKTEFTRLKTLTPRLWLSSLTKLGFADLVAPGEDAGTGGLTVVEMGELVRRFETENNENLRRLAGLLAALRDTVREHGGPCVTLSYRPSQPSKHAVHVHSAGPEQAPVLLDWHKEYFWSK